MSAKNIKIPEVFKECKLIPLTRNSKIARVKWGTDDKLKFDGTETGYGIDTGRSNLCVIDCDTKGDVNGLNNFIALCEKNGGIPNTLTVETPNNGVHFYFTNKNKEVNSSASTVFGDGIDVRANGGYIVGPGSIILNNDGELKTYLIEDEDVEIKELPKWMEAKIIDYVNSHKIKEKNLTNNSKNSPENKTDLDGSFNPHEEEERNNALVWAIDKIKESSEGSRNTVLNSTAYFMGCKRVARDKAEQLIEVAISKGLNLKEAQVTFNSGYEDGLKQEKITYPALVKEFNTQNGVTFKDDPKDSEYYSHVSLSYNFWKKHNHELFYLESNSWFLYDKTKGIWDRVTEELIKQEIKTFCEDLVLKIRKENNRLPMAVYRAQEKIWLKSTIDAIEGVARLDFLRRKSEQKFDVNPYFVNCKNGVYDIQNDQLLEHDKNYCITKYIPINYIREAKDKYCDLVIESISSDQRKYMQYICGQALMGEQPMSQSAFFLHGSGSNGKTTFIDLINRTSGDYGKVQSPDILLPSNGKEVYAMADFEGIRQAIIEELPDSKQLNSGSLKRVVGTDEINARAIYSKNTTFKNIATIFVSCNRLPVINENDNGTWRRLTVFTFPYSYKMTAGEIKNDNDKLANPMVIYKSRTSMKTAEAMLSWRLQGARELFLNRQLELIKPESMLETVNTWKENNDLVYGWASQTLKYKENSVVVVSELLTSFNSYLSENGHATISMRFLVGQLGEHYFFVDNKMRYVKTSIIKKNYLLSSIDPSIDIPARPSFLLNAAFIEND